ncbi:hypothetical protein [Vibrio marisflavi]|uniref:Uncharacterized protein n=1 Tax=Vibrio marisflavi CECT 7928 TaxID=634439 RepID=A0ABM8ZZ34_9VIBR|nr:hypothetical protein [Vibrio marisflavi]CAH0536289.1 hypothetical protein VMF7928_00312 [Vibrio marisflavi CECT 7928]
MQHRNHEQTPMAILLVIICMIFVASPLIASIAFDVHPHLHISSMSLGIIALAGAIAFAVMKKRK